MMRKPSIFFTLISLSVASLFWSPVTFSTYYRTPGQEPKIIQQLIEYHDTDYPREIEKKIQDAKDYLERRLTTRKAAKFAMIIDVDESALSNFESLQRMSFTQNPEALASAFMLGDAPPIEPMLALYQFALEKDVAIFFICERPHIPEMVSATVKNLRKAGYDNWTNIIFRPVNNDNLSTVLFKKGARQKIADEDYVIVLNIGDQPSDLEGGYSEVSIKLPNPFYQVL